MRIITRLVLTTVALLVFVPCLSAQSMGTGYIVFWTWGYESGGTLVGQGVSDTISAHDVITDTMITSPSGRIAYTSGYWQSDYAVTTAYLSLEDEDGTYLVDSGHAEYCPPLQTFYGIFTSQQPTQVPPWVDLSVSFVPNQMARSNGSSQFRVTLIPSVGARGRTANIEAAEYTNPGPVEYSFAPSTNTLTGTIGQGATTWTWTLSTAQGNQTHGTITWYGAAAVPGEPSVTVRPGSATAAVTVP